MGENSRELRGLRQLSHSRNPRNSRLFPPNIPGNGLFRCISLVGSKALPCDRSARQKFMRGQERLRRKKSCFGKAQERIMAPPVVKNELDTSAIVSPQDWQRARPVLTVAADLDEKDRTRLIEMHFPSEPTLRSELLSMLETHDRLK